MSVSRALQTCTVLAVLWACSTNGAEPARSTSSEMEAAGLAARIDGPTLARVETAIERARVWYLDQAHEEPFAFLLGNLLHRRFALEGMQAMGQRYLDATKEGAITQLLFRRLISPEWTATPELLAMIVTPLDRVTSPALYCDRIPLPADYPDKLQEAAALGGYELTHALLALLWLDDNGCELARGAALRARVIEQSVALIDLDGTVTDLEIEAAAFAVYAGAAKHVPAAFLERLLDAQLPDGGFGDGAEAVARWHPTGLAMFLLRDLMREPLDSFVPRDASLSTTR